MQVIAGLGLPVWSEMLEWRDAGGRRVVFAHPDDLAELGRIAGPGGGRFADGDVVDVVSEAADGSERRAEAFRLVEKDPGLSRPEHAALREVLLWKWEGRLDLARTG